MLVQTEGAEHAYLMNRVKLDDFLDYMTSWPVGAEQMDREELAQEWRSASDAMRRLRRLESGSVDNAPVEPLPDYLEPLTAEVHSDPYFRNAFADAPATIGVVDLERTIASQLLVNISLVRKLMEQLGPEPTPETVFKFCLPYDHPQTPFRKGRIGEREFAFVSDSCDLRFLDAVMLRPEQISDYRASGPIAGIIGLVVGYGSNYLSAVQVKERLILINGNHRACALLGLGIGQVPCIVQKVPGPEQLDSMVPSAVRRDKDFYLKNPRPPVIKDYFNPALAKTVFLAQSAREIRVGYSHESRDVP